ncbi:MULTISPECIES: hypothetical protein [unclassified Bosea (in: a-proteobacteria)]|uniref:hypothetical protein n=1 Tax=unclassified Bosea (in: a-proteobacteria) TaxID=2653178 RepID=UPI000F75AC6F|nr:MULTISPECIES: hypothetical protein [unclassified Bosea (in: a-proteobacteria)]AZO77746.1 hypothetical protein BLM15_09035 [Bosea sp. Tri-49]RXT18360.1 hypothetical protein B5U98_24190 [Bosea sp. Tri-39]RXT32956.1 hypothetical protein B5U99_30535 [Bosea sp. Tri-54]
MLIALAPVIADNDPLPAEILATADGASHAAGDLLMRTSSLAGAIRRGGPIDMVEEQFRLAADKARTIAEACERAATGLAAISHGGRQ